MSKPILKKEQPKRLEIEILIKSISIALFFIFCQSMLLSAEEVPCSKNGYITKSKNGSINWSTGIITAKGEAFPSKEDKDKTSSSIPGAAKTNATKNLISILKDIKITNKTVKEFVASNDDIMAQIENTVSDVSAIEQHYTSDGALEIEVAASLYGSFLQFILPSEIVQIPEIERIETNVDDKVQKQRGRYTGLVVDARELKFQPVLYPVIKNEYGEEIYSSVFINREYAVQYGVCKYFCSMEQAVINDRAGDNPMVVKALRVGENKNSIIINKPDAEKIEKIIEHYSFFKECRVIIVLNQQNQVRQQDQ